MNSMIFQLYHFISLKHFLFFKIAMLTFLYVPINVSFIMKLEGEIIVATLGFDEKFALRTERRVKLER